MRENERFHVAKTIATGAKRTHLLLTRCGSKWLREFLTRYARLTTAVQVGINKKISFHVPSSTYFQDTPVELLHWDDKALQALNLAQ